MLKFLIVSHHYVKFSGYRPCGSSDTAAKIFYVTLQDHVIEGSELLIAYPHPAKFDNHRHSVNEYIIILVCHILQDHVILWSCDFMGRSHLR